jgi:hypothetical protein
MFLGSNVRPAHKADNLTAICEQNVQKTWDPQHLTILQAPQPVTGTASLLLILGPHAANWTNGCHMARLSLLRHQ